MGSYTVEQVEFLRQRADISYEEALEVLERCNGDLTRCLVDLERRGLIRKSKGDKTSRASGITRTPYSSAHRSGAYQEGSSLGALLKKLVNMRLVVTKEQRTYVDLPVIYLCECNDWAIGTNFERVTKEHDISRRAAAFGLPGVLVDGFNVLEVYKAVSEAAERARRGEGPTLIEAKYMRMAGHHVGDDQNYRTREDLDSISALYELDPIKRLGELLRANGIEDSVLENIAARQRAAIDEAVRFASEDCSEPPVDELYDDVFSDIRVE